MSQYVLGDAFSDMLKTATDFTATVTGAKTQAQGMFSTVSSAGGMFATGTKVPDRKPPQNPPQGSSTIASRFKLPTGNAALTQVTGSANIGAGNRTSSGAGGSSMPSVTVLALGAAAVVAAFLLIK